MEKTFYEQVLNMVNCYRKAIHNIGFAQCEREKLKKEPENESELLEMLEVIINSNKELNFSLEEAPNSIVISNQDGVYLRMNKAYENIVKVSREKIFGKTAEELARNRIFEPSVCLLTLKEARPVTVLQDIRNTKTAAVTGGAPVFDENGKLYRVITNAISTAEIDSLSSYIKSNDTVETGEQNNVQKKVIAESDAMKNIIELADLIKNTESSILITGETGVGKGVLARYIHETGNRSAGNFININCGAIPENLLESELFGYESGAFTGADKKGKRGLIELADQGTLFLDEIGELPLFLQVKILHFIQTRMFIRVGGTKEVEVDTRIISATNKNLEEEIRKGTFRSDLYYRLNVIPIQIPPLRHRSEDIEAVARHFMNHYTEKYHKNLSINKETENFIRSYDWPGNIRELENYIERLVVTGAQESFMRLKNEKETNREELQNNAAKTVAEVEAEMILAAYEKYGSSYKVAEVLGISQSTAYRKIKKYLKEQKS